MKSEADSINNKGMRSKRKESRGGENYELKAPPGDFQSKLIQKNFLFTFFCFFYKLFEQSEPM